MPRRKRNVPKPASVGWAGVRFVHVRHEVTGGEADIPPQLVEHHRTRGWEPTESNEPPESSSDEDKADRPLTEASTKKEG